MIFAKVKIHMAGLIYQGGRTRCPESGLVDKLGSPELKIKNANFGQLLKKP